MTPQELSEIRERCDKATPGPWHAEEPTVTWGASVWAKGMRVVHGDHAAFDEANAAFIAAARADVPRLLDEVERLKAELETAMEALNAINDIRNHIVGTQAINWSADIYPLVAALDKAGLVGLHYEEARALASKKEA